jgi:hypothetical protein
VNAADDRPLNGFILGSSCSPSLDLRQWTKVNGGDKVVNLHRAMYGSGLSGPLIGRQIFGGALLRLNGAQLNEKGRAR